MFIKEVVKKFKKAGKKYVQHRLVESHRTPMGPRQRTVLHLGTLDLPREKWKDLANTIESIVTNQKIMFPVTKEIVDLAQHYAAIILRNSLNQEIDHSAQLPSDSPVEVEPLLSASPLIYDSRIVEGSTLSTESGVSPDYENIDINSLKNSDARPIGAEHIAFSQMKEYRFFDFLKQLNFSQRQIMTSAALIVGRLVHPGSELETARWVRESSGIGEFLGEDLSKLSDQGLHRTGDTLWKHHDAIERYLSEKAQKVFSLDNTILLYDLTNTYFETSKKGSEIAFFGKSKEKRTDCPLVTLALVVDGEGFPKLSKIFRGDVSEPATLAKILDTLSGLGPDGKMFRKTVVIDAGIATDDNLNLLREKSYDYIAVSRRRSYDESFWKDGSWQDIKLKNQKEILSIKSERTADEVFLLCHSNRKESTESSILKNRTSKFEMAVNEINDKLNRKNRKKAYEKVLEQIGRIKEKYKVGHYYDIQVSQENGVAITVSFKKKDTLASKEGMLGNYVLRTNRKDLLNEEISTMHRILTRIEQSFRSMKTDLGVRPVHHQLDKRIESHLFITVLGYHILAPVLFRAQNVAGIAHSWRSIKNVISTHQRVTTTCMTKDGYRIDVRNSTTPTPKQIEIYKALGITPYPLKNRFSKIKANK
jgi:hypothetical protein